MSYQNRRHVLNPVQHRNHKQQKNTANHTSGKLCKQLDSQTNNNINITATKSDKEKNLFSYIDTQLYFVYLFKTVARCTYCPIQCLLHEAWPGGWIHSETCNTEMLQRALTMLQKKSAKLYKCFQFLLCKQQKKTSNGKK